MIKWYQRYHRKLKRYHSIAAFMLSLAMHIVVVVVICGLCFGAALTGMYFGESIN